jgi:flagellar FliL protein
MSKKLLLIVSAAVLLVLSGLGGGFFLMWNKISTLEANQTSLRVDTEAAVAAPEPPSAKMGDLVSLEPFIINLAESQGKRYLKATLELELAPEAKKDVIAKRVPQFRDAILTILPTKRYEDICSVEGKETLRSEIKSQLNTLMASEEITNIYFTEFVVQ